MKDIKANYKLAFLIPTVALLLSGCSSRNRNIVTHASPNQIIIKDLEDGQERLFISPKDSLFQYLRVNDTVEIYVHGNARTKEAYMHRRIFTNSQNLGVTDISLEKALLRSIKENWRNTKTK